MTKSSLLSFNNNYSKVEILSFLLIRIAQNNTTILKNNCKYQYNFEDLTFFHIFRSAFTPKS